MPTTITELFLNRTKQYQLLPIDTLFELLHVSDAIIWIAAKTSSLLLDWFQSRRELTWEGGSNRELVSKTIVCNKSICSDNKRSFFERFQAQSKSNKEVNSRRGTLSSSPQHLEVAELKRNVFTQQPKHNNDATTGIKDDAFGK